MPPRAGGLSASQRAVRRTASRAGTTSRWPSCSCNRVQIEHPMRRQRLREQRPRGHGQLVRHRDDLQVGAQLGRAQLHHLADREHFLVGDVEDRSRAASGMLDSEHDCSRAVLRVAVVVQREALVGDDDAAATVEDAADHRPFARRRLVRAVQVGVAKVRGAGVRGEHRLLGAHDAVPLLVDRRIVDQGRVLTQRNRETGGLVQPGVGPTESTRARRRPRRSGHNALR